MTLSALEPLRSALGHRYAIERELGRGGMGAVYLARDRQLDRPVALKVLPPEFAVDAGLRARFLRETRTAASFSHPNIVPVFAVEETAEVLAFAMAFVEGESLSARVSRAGPLSAREAVRLLQDIGYALAYAHGRGVVHRDLKPDNIMIERATGRALLMDFGISRTISTETTSAVPGLTRVGEVVGTPEFMSPEQACGDTVDGRSDLYALGLVAYFALTGALAISGESTQRILVQQLTQPVASVGGARPDLPAALVEAVDRCTRKEPDDRFATAESLIEALDAAQLSAPEVPYALRQFAREVGTIHYPILACVAMCAVVWYYVTRVLEYSAMDAFFAQSLFVAVAATRVWQLRSERQRLHAEGYDGHAIMRGFQSIVDERKEARVRLRAQPAVVSRRRRVLAAAVGLFLLSFLVGLLGKATRTQIGPTAFEVPPLGVFLFFLAPMMQGAALMAIISTPFLMPIGEGLFRGFWLGRPGRLLLGANAQRVSVGKSVPPSRPITAVQPVPAPPPVAPSLPGVTAPLPEQFAPQPAAGLTLEARVAELERWRAATETSQRP